MKWVVLGLLWVAYFLLQAMRQVYNASLPQIRADFAAAGATAVSLGLVLSAPCVVLAVRARTLAGACAALAAWGFARGIYDSNFFASLYDVVAPRCRAAATGLFCCGGFVLGSFAPTVLGWIAERASMAAGMRSLGWFYLAGGLTILVARHLFMRRPTPGNAPAARP